MPKRIDLSGNVLPAVRRIAIVAPASRPEPPVIEAACERLTAEGFTVQVDPRCFLDAGWTAGDDEARLASLSEAMRNPGVDAILCARGGFGSPRIADSLPPPSGPKVIIGYSDITCLLARGRMLPGVLAVHGPLASDIPNPQKAYGVERLLRLLKGEDLSAELAAHLAGRLQVIHPGPLEGTLAGGNLTSVQLLAGTPLRSALSGQVLMLEEVGERMYEIDRALDHLRRAGIIRDCRGLLIGDMTPRAEDAGFDQETLREVIYRLCRREGRPAYAGLPFGHGAENFPVVLGARLDIA
jgi:muramoyltetrapeptide carboxypeptidase